jgi:cytochrome P450
MATATPSPELSLESLDIISSEHYEQNGYPHREWAYLRKHAPVFWYDRPNVEPFYAITKYADIVEIGKEPEKFIIEPRIAIFTTDFTPPEEVAARHLLNMDPPDHGKYRNVASKQFTPRVVKELEPHVRRITREVLDQAAKKNQGDFVQDVSAKITIAVIAEMLGVPRADWELLFRWTNEIIAPQDPEFQRNASIEETINGARIELFQYFNAMAQERRRKPTHDIVSVVANGLVNGKPLPPLELLSYYFLLVVAGNETTRNAMTGGLLAFIENPGEWAKLKKDASLLDSAVEESVRWTTPVIQFARTATQDYRLRGTTIRKGQSVCLFYASGNRDEEVFPDGDRFRVDRASNPHIAFGRGEHVCLGAHLARLEIRCALEAMRERLESIELAGPVDRVRSSFVGGIKRVPIRYKLTPARA